MNYIQLSLKIANTPEREILIALLSEEGITGFEETEDQLLATMPADEYDDEAIKGIASALNVTYTISEVEEQNWNAKWESDFQPVIVKDFCTVRASFHPATHNTPYEVIITPKMSFGTGHHATTQLMIELMQGLTFTDKTVLDFGTGTGILAILAKMLGASAVTAIDNDEWAVPNSLENAAMNNMKVSIFQGSLEDIARESYHIILANINRNVLLQYMDEMAERLVAGGRLLLSGILEADAEVTGQAASAAGFSKITEKTLNGWMAILYEKH